MLRKVGFGAGFWAVMFLAVSALMVTPLPLIWQSILEIIIAGAAGYVLGILYFKKQPSDVKGAVVLDVTWILVGIVLAAKMTHGGQLMARPQIEPMVKPPAPPSAAI